MPSYLTKSRFKLALECPTKLYYSSNKKDYADQSLDDQFLQALAEGGFQVGELAKYIFSEDPVAEQITIEEKDPEAALIRTNEKLNGKNHAVIAEAAFRFQNYFVRVDITKRVGDELHIYEVKAKSWNTSKSFWKFPRSGEKRLDRGWLPYLQDIAYQKYVVQNANRNLKVYAYLILADSDTAASIEGLNQLFRINKQSGRTSIQVKPNLTRSSLGIIPLKIIPVDEECESIFMDTVDAGLEKDCSFEETIKVFAEAYEKNIRIWGELGIQCKSCQFNNKDGDPNFKSGFEECWKHRANLSEIELKMPLSLELWGGLAGAKSIVGDAIANGKYLLTQIDDSDHWPQTFTPKESGLHPAERRKLQIEKVKKKNREFHLDRGELNKVFNELEPPYHFIDFETSAVALPFHAGRKPYEGLAFQYSYHLMDERGKIEHKSQYISLDAGFPNYDFVRALKNDLQQQPGTIFRYHNHENTYLYAIYKQLLLENDEMIPDRKEIIKFIRDITHSKDKKDEWEGINDMVDLWKMVISYYYSPAAKGSNSIKDILPAVIKDSRYIREKYSKPIYGSEIIPSLNFKNHIWIDDKFGLNPYMTLPPVLQGYGNDDLDQFVPAVDDIAEGGAAMMAYAYLQFSDVPSAQKDLIKNALYRYCELDTMAMVMVWEFWGNEIGRFS